MSDKCKPGSIPVTRLALKRDKCVVLKSPITSPQSVVDWLQKNYQCEPQESVLVIGVTSEMAPIGVQLVSLGGLDQSSVDPRVIFSALLLMNATGFILVHNHPSGSLEPSSPDVHLVAQLKEGARLLSMRLLDSIIVSHRGFTSMQARGLV